MPVRVKFPSFAAASRRGGRSSRTGSALSDDRGGGSFATTSPRASGAQGQGLLFAAALDGGGAPLEEEGAAAAAAAEQQPLSHSWYVAEVLEHRLWRGKAGRHEFRVRWVGLRPNDRRHKKWHSLSIFCSYGADGCLPGETTCTLVDSKIGDFMARHKIAM